MHEERDFVTLDDTVAIHEVLRLPTTATEELEGMSAPIAPALIYAGYIAGASLAGTGVGFGVAWAID